MIIELKKINKNKITSVIGIDWGEKRIGIAGSDRTLTLSSPLKQTENNKLLLQKILDIMLERKSNTIVLGIANNLDGTKSQTNDKIEKFIKKLYDFLKEKITDLQITTFDERMTSYAVENMLITQYDYSREKRKKVLDKLSATYLLQNFLDYINRLN